MNRDDFPTVEQRNARQLAAVIDEWKAQVDERFAALEARVTHLETDNTALRQQLMMALVAGRGTGPTSAHE